MRKLLFASSLILSFVTAAHAEQVASPAYAQQQWQEAQALAPQPLLALHRADIAVPVQPQPQAQAVTPPVDSWDVMQYNFGM